MPVVREMPQGEGKADARRWSGRAHGHRQAAEGVTISHRPRPGPRADRDQRLAARTRGATPLSFAGRDCPPHTNTTTLRSAMPSPGSTGKMLFGEKNPRFAFAPSPLRLRSLPAARHRGCVGLRFRGHRIVDSYARDFRRDVVGHGAMATRAAGKVKRTLASAAGAVQPAAPSVKRAAKRRPQGGRPASPLPSISQRGRMLNGKHLGRLPCQRTCCCGPECSEFCLRS